MGKPKAAHIPGIPDSRGPIGLLIAGSGQAIIESDPLPGGFMYCNLRYTHLSFRSGEKS